MKITEAAQEVLEELWIETVEGGKKSVASDDPANGGLLRQLAQSHYVSVLDGRVSLTPEGHEEAKKITRRHRLAERLLHDVLDVREDDMEASACKFEHIISEGVEESICVLLGHPGECPHGKPIPPGRCCQEGKETAERVVSPLSRLHKGERGEIVYLLSKHNDNLQKLLAMGILPGKPIEAIQTFPSYVFQVGQTQVAVDAEIANAIFVRLA